MSIDLRELYQELILDHNRRPRNFGKLPDQTAQAQGHNPLCGDTVVVHLLEKDGVVEDIKFEGVGCAISTASASLMTEAVKGKTHREAEELFLKFQAMVTAADQPAEDDESMGSLQALAGVRDHPVRIKCATLSWHALHAALQGGEALVSTE